MKQNKKNMEQTLLIIKPDAFCKKLVGNIISRFEKQGFRILACRMFWINLSRAKMFYQEHKSKRFHSPLSKFIASNPLMALVLEGEDAVSEVRKIIGDTDPLKAKRGTVRRLYAQDDRFNILHGSDSRKSAKREIRFFFTPKELYHWKARTYRK